MDSFTPGNSKSPFPININQSGESFNDFISGHILLPHGLDRLICSRCGVAGCGRRTIACFSNLTATSYALLLSNMCCRITFTCITCITCVTCIKCITCSACYCPISVAVSHGGVYSDALGIVYTATVMCCSAAVVLCP